MIRWVCAGLLRMVRAISRTDQPSASAALHSL